MDNPGFDPARAALVEALRSTTRPPTERAEAGRALALLGDPRAEVMTLEGMEFCWVPAGPFWMGSPESDEGAREEERPLHELDIPYDYWLARYPVTNAQFAAFVAAGGYREARYWQEARAAGRWSEAGFQGFRDQAPRTELAPLFAPYDLSNHPIVNMTWYEALAVTYWLTEQWRAAEFLPEDWSLVLPSEAEWEKGARGGQSIPPEPVLRAVRAGFERVAERPQRANPLPQRRYPWGDEASPHRASYDETKIGSTSAVGCFPSGASPYGCEEMSGSVWEWLRSSYTPYPPALRGEEQAQSELLNAQHMLRGGSFANNVRVARCAFRFRNHPFDRNLSWGFRVALLPSRHGKIERLR